MGIFHHQNARIPHLRGLRNRQRGFFSQVLFFDLTKHPRFPLILAFRHRRYLIVTSSSLLSPAYTHNYSLSTRLVRHCKITSLKISAIIFLSSKAPVQGRTKPSRKIYFKNQLPELVGSSGFFLHVSIFFTLPSQKNK